MGTQLPLPKKEHSPPNFRPMFIVAKRLDGSRWHMAWRPRPRPHCARWRPSSPTQKGAQRRPLFGSCSLRPNGWSLDGSWIKLPLCTKVGLVSCNIVLDTDPAPARQGAHYPILGPCLLWPNGWMDQNATWFKGQGRPRPRPHCVTWDPSPAKRGTAPIIGPCLLWPNGRPSQLLLSTCLYIIRTQNTAGTVVHFTQKMATFILST